MICKILDFTDNIGGFMLFTGPLNIILSSIFLIFIDYLK